MRALPGVCTVVLALAVSGCGVGSRSVSDPEPDLSAYPVVAGGQARSILDAVEGALVRGVEANDKAADVDARLVGPFRELILAEAKVAAEQKRKVAAPARIERRRLIVPAARAWPRFFIAVGNSNKASTPVLRVLSSQQARAPYGLWAEATMLPGATLPETAAAATGSPLISADTGGLVATPREVVAGFAGYLNEGAKTTASKQYRRSIYSDQLLQRLYSDRKALKAVATISSTHKVGASEPLAVRTSDGGALVIGELIQTYRVTVKKGKGTVKVSDQDLAALANGKKQFSTSFTRTAVEVVVFKVPLRGKGLITVIAAQKGDVKAVAK